MCICFNIWCGMARFFRGKVSFFVQASSLECYIASCHLPFLNSKNLATGLSKLSNPHCFPQVQKSWIVSFLCNWWCGEKTEFRWKFFILGEFSISFLSNSNYSWSWIIKRVKSKLEINLGWNYFNLMLILIITYTLYKTWCFNFFYLDNSMWIFYISFSGRCCREWQWLWKCK